MMKNKIASETEKEIRQLKSIITWIITALIALALASAVMIAISVSYGLYYLIERDIIRKGIAIILLVIASYYAVNAYFALRKGVYLPVLHAITYYRYHTGKPLIEYSPRWSRFAAVFYSLITLLILMAIAWILASPNIVP